MKYIFDLDGTLIDSSERHKFVFRDVMSQYKIPVSQKVLDEYLEYKLLGRSTKQYLSEMLKISPNDAQTISEKWVSLIEDSVYLQLDNVYDDVFPLLKSLPKNDIIFLTARRNKDGLQDELIRLNLSKYTDRTYVVSPMNTKLEKRSIIQDISLEDDVLIVGDTEVEYDISADLNLKCFILNRGFRSKKYWDGLGINSYESLISLYDYLC